MRKSLHYLLLLSVFSVAVFSVAAQNKKIASQVMVTDKLNPAPFGSIKIDGYVGDKLNLCLDNRVMAQDIDRLITPFQLRNDGPGVSEASFGASGLPPPCSVTVIPPQSSIDR